MTLLVRISGPGDFDTDSDNDSDFLKTKPCSTIFQQPLPASMAFRYSRQSIALSIP